MNKIALSLVGFLFLVIVLLAAYTYGFIPSLSKKQAIQKILVTTSKPQTFSNTTPEWMTHDIINGRIQILHPLQIHTTLSVKISKDAPLNTSAGLLLANKLEEKDINARRLSFYYYLKNKQWILKYQAGEISKFYGILYVKPDKAFGNFSFLIAANGKKITLTLPNKTEKTIYFPDSLYDITNQMSLKALTGPKSTITFSSLSYKQLSP